jgi:hypothetical protein
MSRDNDNVVSIGDDFRNYDRRFWGWRDRARAQREDALTDHSTSWLLPGNTQLVPDTVASFRLYGESEAEKARRTRRNIARLEQKLGRRPRSEW